MNKFSFCIYFVLYFHSTSISAVVIEDLYTINVQQSLDICGTGSEEEQSTYGEGMVQLLSRITGFNSDYIFANPDLVRLIEGAERFVFLCGPRLNENELSIGFNDGLLESELAILNIPRWGKERPVTLLWLAIDTGEGELGILSSKTSDLPITNNFKNFQQKLYDEIKYFSNIMALPVILPLLDLQDISFIIPDDIIKGRVSKIEDASDRYYANYILYANGYISEYGRLEAHWSILRQGNKINFGYGTLEYALNQLSLYYANEFKIEGDVSDLKVTILGIDSLDDYANTIRHFESLSLLEEVEPIEVNNGSLILQVKARGDQDLLDNILGLDSFLVKSNENTENSGIDGLFFRLKK